MAAFLSFAIQNPKTINAKNKICNHSFGPTSVLIADKELSEGNFSVVTSFTTNSLAGVAISVVIQPKTAICIELTEKDELKILYETKWEQHFQQKEWKDMVSIIETKLS